MYGKIQKNLNIIPAAIIPAMTPKTVPIITVFETFGFSLGSIDSPGFIGLIFTGSVCKVNRMVDRVVGRAV